MLSMYRPLNDLMRSDWFGYDLLAPHRGNWAAARDTAQQQPFTPLVDVVEKPDRYEVHVEIPGVKNEDLEIEVLDGLLTVRGERRSEHDEQTDKYRKTERAYGRFERSFTLPKGTDTEAIAARTDAGVVVIDVPKPATKSAEARRIEVKSESLASKAKKVLTGTR